MMYMEEKTILEFARKQGYEAVTFWKKWNGYDCYEPIFFLEQPVSYIGLPLMILVKGETIRMSTPEEAMDMLD